MFPSLMLFGAFIMSDQSLVKDSPAEHDPAEKSSVEAAEKQKSNT